MFEPGKMPRIHLNADTASHGGLVETPTALHPETATFADCEQALRLLAASFHTPVRNMMLKPYGEMLELNILLPQAATSVDKRDNGYHAAHFLGMLDAHAEAPDANEFLIGDGNPSLIFKDLSNVAHAINAVALHHRKQDPALWENISAIQGGRQVA